MNTQMARAAWALAALLALSAPGGRGARAQAPAPAPAALGAALERLLPEAHDVAGRWEVVREAAADPVVDPDLREWGVRAIRARHYTRTDREGVQVCSIELWAFQTEAGAARALAEIDYPSWQFAREGAVLMMVRGLTRPRGVRDRWEVFADCRALSDGIRRRLAAAGPAL
jgi:hypothetical protein